MSQTSKRPKNSTTIGVSAEVRDELFDRKSPGDSYDDVLRRMLDL